MAAKVAFEPSLLDGLARRFPYYPITAISRIVRKELTKKYRAARPAPSPPYSEGTLVLDMIAETAEGTFRATPVFYWDSADAALIVVSLGVWPEPRP